MKNIVKTAIVLIVLATGCWALIPGTNAVEAPPAEASPASLYRAHCARCHGMDGHANTPDGQKTEADDLTDSHVQGMDTARIARLITNGRGKMPAFKRQMSAAEINSVAAYVKSRF